MEEEYREGECFCDKNWSSDFVADKNGLKRQWQLQDKADDMGEESSDSKRFKGLEVV